CSTPGDRTLLDPIARLPVERRRKVTGHGGRSPESAQTRGVNVMEHGVIEEAGRSIPVRRETVALVGGLALLITAALASPAAARPKPFCGDNVAQGSEACDGTDLRNETCLSLGFAGGSLSCTPSCTFETGQCLSILRYIDNGDGTVTDTSTGLQWEKKDGTDGVADYSNPHDVDNVYTWGDLAGCPIAGCANGTGYTDFLARLNYCVSDGTTTVWPGFAGHCDWRLPTIDELASIIDYNSPTCQNGPCIDPIFGPSEHIYGSSTTPPPAPVPTQSRDRFPPNRREYPPLEGPHPFRLPPG